MLVCVLSAFFVVINRMHTEGHDRCIKAGGVWLDREMKCIESREIKP
jgi:Zn-finger nucleic acid-binding protein